MTKKEIKKAIKLLALMDFFATVYLLIIIIWVCWKVLSV